MGERLSRPAVVLALLIGLMLAGCAGQQQGDDNQHHGFYGAVEGGMTHP
jgi:hypothetical protein